MRARYSAIRMAISCAFSALDCHNVPAFSDFLTMVSALRSKDCRVAHPRAGNTVAMARALQSPSIAAA
ncbi:MAG TPA: hypothetical protein VEC06_06885 [Paucimonas sp.]|nr:hypothetical protein [Paucimonas sp.]